MSFRTPGPRPPAALGGTTVPPLSPLNSNGLVKDAERIKGARSEVILQNAVGREKVMYAFHATLSTCQNVYE